MNQRELLNLSRWPARLDAHDTAVALGFTDHDIPVLVKAKLLKPLGNPAPNSPKWFSTIEIVALAQDRSWLDKATKAVANHWKGKNERRHCDFLTSAPMTATST